MIFDFLKYLGDFSLLLLDALFNALEILFELTITVFPIAFIILVILIIAIVEGCLPSCKATNEQLKQAVQWAEATPEIQSELLERFDDEILSIKEFHDLRVMHENLKSQEEEQEIIKRINQLKKEPYAIPSNNLSRE